MSPRTTVSDGADALLVLTEWQPYRRPDFQRLKESLREVLDSSSDPRLALMHFVETASEEESTILRDGLSRRDQRS